MNIEPIAVFHSPFMSKFGIPRQSSIVGGLRGRVELTGAFARPEALRGLEGYDYVWLIWGFSANTSAVKHATVRPPLLGGNERVGVWASRSPFRPNNLGLSSVRIVRVNREACTIDVAGADLMDGTPVYDIKPYLPYADSHADARGGFADQHAWQRLMVELAPEVAELLTSEDATVLKQVLELDPRPHYHSGQDARCYGMPFKDWDVQFTVAGGVLRVVHLKPLAGHPASP